MRVADLPGRLRWEAAHLPYYALCLPSWVAAKRRLRERDVATPDELRAARRSDRVFVFGSGWSLNEIGQAEWDDIAAHDTFGFNWFVHQEFVRVDYHLIRQIADSNDRAVWEPQQREYFRLMDASPHYASTFLLVQHELRARGPNLALQHGVFPRRNRVLPWHSSGGTTPSRSWNAGLAHVSSTLFDTVNAAYLLGWREIVLVGVDLYDRRYFWLEMDETRPLDRERGASAADAHSQSSAGLVQSMAAWRDELARDGVTLSVHNPRSLLSAELPVFVWA